MEGITLQEHFASLEDPRVERTKHHQSTSYYYDRFVRRDLRSRYLGGCGGVWQVQTSMVRDISGVTQRHSFA